MPVPVTGESLPELPPQYLPFLRLLTRSKLGGDVEPDHETNRELVDATAELQVPDFWKPARVPDQERLKGRLFQELLNRRLLPADDVDAVVDKLVELGRANQTAWRWQAPGSIRTLVPRPTSDDSHVDVVLVLDPAGVLIARHLGCY